MQLVQARMWSQGLTVGVLVASAIVAGTTSKEGQPVERVDHSWEDILGTLLFLLLAVYGADTRAEAEGQMKHEDRMEVRQRKVDRQNAEIEQEKKQAAAKASA